jgi:hypothetical protein
MGIRSSQDIFQRKIDETLEGLQGVMSIIDDLLVFGSNVQIMTETLRTYSTEQRQPVYD